MFNLKTSIPEIDRENEMLFRAAAILEKCGNGPGLTANQFYEALEDAGVDIAAEEFTKLTTAAIAIETMMAFEQAALTDNPDQEPTIH